VGSTTAQRTAGSSAGELIIDAIAIAAMLAAMLLLVLLPPRGSNPPVEPSPTTTCATFTAGEGGGVVCSR
jgi:hypothetical protein